MSNDQVIINQAALAEIAQNLKSFGMQYYDALEKARQDLLFNGISWNDGDASQLISAVKVLTEGAKTARSAADQLCERIESKIEAVEALHRMKI